ncbi:tRNA (adenosine(37)-N6)-threonylcarbamoyltransferase complex dimerization subunit type 1 TsaB [Hyphococcus flavus]|uniref:tRNA (Adenosine(37)-N6)-threonylcarbamoyltransferase complex dimerization subunit type 1 TsaB n=1 Tax=Hyphococcus flavus TaxID=1866326 RepID=A0AAE9ZK74_9PROT|nr:tRNA (adenosine(37)-N6)-threonylcarbamoyltransferase complex dimerization subunit type 1 TsaB [Hyphococcus flavus]WDI32676.1 tRNA (adenosine(37)-N6)-threonylcarbamoyltransferase complex dimerization subunit type 1 TsaB [Hyphococcus flavus]
MLVMGLDTALQRCSVAILSNGAVLADVSSAMERGHAEHLAPMAANALRQAGARVRDLGRVGVVVGPGGFTGVRVGLSFVRGLGVGTGIEIVGVTSLAALAANIAPDTDLIAPVIDARRGQVYAAVYDTCGSVIVPPFVAAPADAKKKIDAVKEARMVTFAGSGAPLIDPSLSGEAEIDAKAVARLAAAASAPSAPPAPLYLRAPDAKPGRPSVFQPVSS